MAADNMLRNFALFVNGRGLAGNCEEYTPPKLAEVTEDYKAGGMDASLKIPMGQEAMECAFTLTKFDPNVLGLWGVAPGNYVPFVVRGALQSADGTITPVTEYTRGRIRETDAGNWQPLAKVSLKFTCDLTYYRREINGVTVTEIDVLNIIRIVNGVDVLAAIRSAIGLA